LPHFPNVVIGDRTVIGDNVVIQANTVFGGDAFYYRKLNGNFDRLISVGNVIIENNVEIGNCCTIDRGVTASTTIGEGSILIIRSRLDTIQFLVKNVLSPLKPELQDAVLSKMK
jgi:serine acetyltransferase